MQIQIQIQKHTAVQNQKPGLGVRCTVTARKSESNLQNRGGQAERLGLLCMSNKSSRKTEFGAGI